MYAAALALATIRADVELKVLRTVAPLGSRGLAIVTAAGVTAADFLEPDTAVVFAALLLADAEGFAGDRVRTAWLVVRALRVTGWYDDSDNPTFAEPRAMRWSAASVAGLFTSYAERRAESLVRIFARQLRAMPRMEVAA